MMDICQSCAHCGLDEARMSVFCNENKDTPHKHILCLVLGAVHPPSTCEEYANREEIETLAIQKLTTHESIVEALRVWLRGKLWWSGMLSEFDCFSADTGGVPDLIAWKQNHKHKAFEVKRKDAKWSEIRQGIGQCIMYLAYDVEPYLVVHESLGDKLLPALSEVKKKRVGLILYTVSKFRVTFRVVYGLPI